MDAGFLFASGAPHQIDPGGPPDRDHDYASGDRPRQSAPAGIGWTGLSNDDRRRHMIATRGLNFGRCEQLAKQASAGRTEQELRKTQGIHRRTQKLEEGELMHKDAPDLLKPNRLAKSKLATFGLVNYRGLLGSDVAIEITVESMTSPLVLVDT